MTRRNHPLITWAAAAVYALLLVGAGGVARADIIPPGCSEHRFDVYLSRDCGAVDNGRVVTYTITAFNGAFPPTCQMREVTIMFYPPGADGLPDMAAGIPVAINALFDPGDTVTYPPIEVTVNVDPGIHSARAMVVWRGDLQDAPVPDSQSGSKTVVVCVLRPCIEVTKTATPAVARVGDTVSYEICVTNCGDIPLINVTVSDPMLGGDLSASFPGTLLPDAEACASFPYTVQEGDPDPLANTVTATGDYLLIDASGTVTDTDDAVVDIAHPYVRVTKSADPTTASVGEIVAYTICVQNIGDVILNNITVMDSLLGDLSGSYADSLPPTESECHAFPYVVQPSDPNPLINTVDVQADPAGPPGVVTDSAVAMVEVVPEQNHPPVCCLTWTPPAPDDQIPVQFTDCSTDSDGDDIVSWEWDFGDGQTATEQHPVHLFAAGSYNVCLTVTDNGEPPESSTCCQTVTVKRAGLKSCFTYTPPLPTTAEPVAFTDCSTAQWPASIVDWEWDFGDGWTSAQQHPTHLYAQGGCFQVALTVTNTYGLSDTQAEVITVRSPHEVPLLQAGWHMVSTPWSADCPLVGVVVRDDITGTTHSFCDAVGIWVMNPLFYYDTARRTYEACGCVGVNPPTTEHTIRMGYGYWLYTFRDYLTVVFP